MDVLREPTHELNYYEKLTVTFVHKWKHGGEKEGWWRRARFGRPPIQKGKRDGR